MNKNDGLQAILHLLFVSLALGGSSKATDDAASWTSADKEESELFLIIAGALFVTACCCHFFVFEYEERNRSAENSREEAPAGMDIEAQDPPNDQADGPADGPADDQSTNTPSIT